MSDTAKMAPVVAILLAAGESTRMGQPKPTLAWHGQTLVEYQIRELQDAGVQVVIVVLGHRADEVQPLVERTGARAVTNHGYREGRASSIRVGADAVPDGASSIVLLSVDQPRSHKITGRLIEEHHSRGGLITVPTFEGRGGHPLILSGRLLSELRSVKEESAGLRAILRRHAKDRQNVPIVDPTVLLDLNLPAEYEQAVQESS